MSGDRMTRDTPVTLELTQAELDLLTSAVRSFASNFGHDQADVLREIKTLLGKLTDAQAA